MRVGGGVLADLELDLPQSARCAGASGSSAWARRATSSASAKAWRASSVDASSAKVCPFRARAPRERRARQRFGAREVGEVARGAGALHVQAGEQPLVQRARGVLGDAALVEDDVLRAPLVLGAQVGRSARLGARGRRDARRRVPTHVRHARTSPPQTSEAAAIGIHQRDVDHRCSIEVKVPVQQIERGGRGKLPRTREQLSGSSCCAPAHRSSPSTPSKSLMVRWRDLCAARSDPAVSQFDPVDPRSAF